MNTFPKSAITILFLLCTSTGYAGGQGSGHGDRCIAVDGTVSSTAIDCSHIPADDYTVLCPQGSVQDGNGGNCLPQCFSIAGKGKAKIKGGKSFSVLTSVVLAN